MTKKFDYKAPLAIAGGGLAGMTLAALLDAAGVESIVIDREKPLRQTAPGYDIRTTALSLASARVLRAAGVWPSLEKYCEPILDIRVADGSAPLFLHFSAEDDGTGEPFGWIVDNRILRETLFDYVAGCKSVTHLTGSAARDFSLEPAGVRVGLDNGKQVFASLLIGADGRQSAVRQWLGIETRAWDYPQAAVVCATAHEFDHEQVAVEHFLPEGPFAILPMTRGEDGSYRSSVVWTVPRDQAQSLAALPDDAFNAQLSEKFGPHLGWVRRVGSAACYPLSLLHAKSYIGPRTALMAEAAHVIHPIAGQGLNLSMRDVASLAELVVDATRLGLDIGSDALLEKYESWRRPDTQRMAMVTDGLNRLFSNDVAAVAMARSAGLGLVERLGPLKRFFASQAMGTAGTLPRVVRGEPL